MKNKLRPLYVKPHRKNIYMKKKSILVHIKQKKKTHHHQPSPLKNKTIIHTTLLYLQTGTQSHKLKDRKIINQNENTRMKYRNQHNGMKKETN